MAMFSAHFDESGHPDESKYLVVAGAVADVQQWVNFEREWLEVLAPLGTKIFHTVDFDKRNPPFDKLTVAEADALFQKLIGIICDRVEQTIAQAIPMQQYDTINAKYVFAELYGFPYPLCARSCWAKVETWAAKHSVPAHEILWFLEDGAKHKGQLKWIAERDHLPEPDFPNKSGLVPLQCGDVLAWCNNLFLTSGKLDERYRRGMDQLYKQSSEWEIIDLSDPDRLPTIMGIPLRDPSYNYKHKIIRKDGKRRPVVHYWPKKNRAEPKLERKTLTLPEPLSRAEVIKAADKYDARGH